MSLRLLFNIKKRILYIIGGLIILFISFLLFIPPIQFQDPYSTVLLDKNQQLLGARVATDGQWRFPVSDSLPEKYIQALLCYEDRYFYNHPGINPGALFRAVGQNVRNKKIISGGSTLTMQLARLADKGKSRTYFQKLWESLKALRSEIAYSKQELLNLYAAHAPFGGNVVGIEAASWRYFAQLPARISWAEAATLAVLPNAPSLIYPGKNQERLIEKRNRLLHRMLEQGIIDQDTYQLAILEPVPGKPHDLPDIASHLLERSVREGYKGKRLFSTIDRQLQVHVNRMLENAYAVNKANDIHNAAALVIHIPTGEIRSYVGNTPVQDRRYGGKVDMISAERSYGSLLKPFLYAAMLTEGELLPSMLVDDIPVSISGYNPQNFSKTYEGVVPAHEVLSKSLNVPSVVMLKQYGYDRFNELLKNTGMRSLHRHSSHYGLSIILGGAEGRLWELAGMYAAMGHKLISESDSFSISYLKDHKSKSQFSMQKIDIASVWFTLEAITEAHRPGEYGSLVYFNAPEKIAWKTGTSYGHRDAWSIGLSGEYAVAVWVGNAHGEGRPNLTGLSYAAPLMFEVFNRLPSAKSWYTEPIYAMKPVDICKRSGYVATANCVDKITQTVPDVVIKTQQCPYHKLVHLDQSGMYRVNDQCIAVSEMKTESRFVLPPVQEWFYRRAHSDYLPLPPYKKGCVNESSVSKQTIGLIYPYPNTKLYLPKETEDRRAAVIWKASHRQNNATIYWHLDHEFVGKTTGTHHLEIRPQAGKYTLTLIDEEGENYITQVEIIE